MSNQTPLELWQVEAWGHATTAPEQVRAIAGELLAARTTITALRSRVAELEGALKDEADYAHRLQVALTDLSGGGSENFVRHGDGFRADIPYILERIRKQREEAHNRTVKAIKERNEARAALTKEPTP